MILLFTSSVDGTSDRLVNKLNKNIFRLNYDLWDDYIFYRDVSNWSIKNPTGLEITSKTITKAFWWKAFSTYPNSDEFIKSEIRYTFRDLYGWCKLKGFVKGNSPDFHNYFGKMTILEIANKYFQIPKSAITINKVDTIFSDNNKIVAKSLSSEQTSDGKVLYTTAIDVKSIDPSYIWFLQEEVKSDYDITIFYCDSCAFAFERNRSNLDGLDWRKDQKLDYSQKEWFPIQISDLVLNKIQKLSKSLNIEFGRYDFLRSKKDGELTFLELNANGQWVFLDINDEYGLLDCVINWLNK